MLYVGLDVRSRQSSLCILNAQAGTVNRVQLKGPRAQVVDHLRRIAEPVSLCYEASCGYGHLYEHVRPLAAHVADAHPARLRLIFGSKGKNDRFDAEKLAKLLLLDVVPQVPRGAGEARHARVGAAVGVCGSVAGPTRASP